MRHTCSGQPPIDHAPNSRSAARAVQLARRQKAAQAERNDERVLLDGIMDPIVLNGFRYRLPGETHEGLYLERMYINRQPRFVCLIHQRRNTAGIERW